ncbi:MAG: ubiquinol-cytochrome c reductase iron-sulfur subunit [Nitrososphaeria archaeon]|nr:ubiquinol-cytochrome c reductase iron-sulfur subunit [Nitrososphaeria archaeon]MDW7986216.1 ubiquinol-cytochrome c reductase iron-sulfur subunit [Nitrososphaerota archaeon]
MISRRRHLRWFVTGVVGVVVGLIFYVVGFRQSNEQVGKTETTRLEETKTKVSEPIIIGTVKEIPRGGQKYFMMDTKPDGSPGQHRSILIHLQPELAERAGVEFVAFSSVCTHMGCTVNYKEMDKIIECPCHGGRYDPITGKVLSGPPPQPIRRIELKIDEVGNIFAVGWD